jgi:hypothetical protein
MFLLRSGRTAGDRVGWLLLTARSATVPAKHGFSVTGRARASGAGRGRCVATARVDHPPPPEWEFAP